MRKSKDWKLVLVLLTLTNFVFGQSFKNIEIFNSSKDIDKRGLKIDSISITFLRGIHDGEGNILFKTLSGKTYFFHKDSIWGYKMNGEIYRSANMKVEIIDDIIIYSAHGFRSSSYSFSKNLDSKVYSLTKHNIKKVFKDNKPFLKALSNQIKCGETYSLRDDKTGQYKIIEIYKQFKYN